MDVARVAAQIHHQTKDGKVDAEALTQVVDVLAKAREAGESQIKADDLEWLRLYAAVAQHIASIGEAADFGVVAKGPGIRFEKIQALYSEMANQSLIQPPLWSLGGTGHVQGTTDLIPILGFIAEKVRQRLEMVYGRDIGRPDARIGGEVPAHERTDQLNQAAQQLDSVSRELSEAWRAHGTALAEDGHTSRLVESWAAEAQRLATRLRSHAQNMRPSEEPDRKYDLTSARALAGSASMLNGRIQTFGKLPLELQREAHEWRNAIDQLGATRRELSRDSNRRVNNAVLTGSAGVFALAITSLVSSDLHASRSDLLVVAQLGFVASVLGLVAMSVGMFSHASITGPKAKSTVSELQEAHDANAKALRQEAQIRLILVFVQVLIWLVAAIFLLRSVGWTLPSPGFCSLGFFR